MRSLLMTSQRKSKRYVSEERIGKENSIPLPLFSVKSNVAFTSDSISELFHSPSSLYFILLKFTSFLFTAFSIKSGFSIISEESYVSQNSPGDLIKAQCIWVTDQARGHDSCKLPKFFLTEQAWSIKYLLSGLYYVDTLQWVHKVVVATNVVVTPKLCS